MAKHELEKLYKKYQKIKQYADGGEVENVDFTDPTVIKALRPQQPISDIEEKSLDSDLIEKPYSDEELKAKAESDNEDDNEDETDDSEDDTDTSDDSKDQPKPTEEPDGKLEVGSTITEPPKDKSDIASLITSLKSSPGPSDLQKAQADRDQELNLNQIQRGAAFIGSGLAKTNPDRILKDIKENDRSALPMQKYNEMIANQQHDPNSPMSQVVNNYLKSKGFNPPEGMSAADALKVMPFLAKDQTLQAQLQKTLLNAQVKTNIAASNQSAMDKRAEAKNKIDQQKADAATENAKSNKGLKAQAGQDKTLQQTKTMLESARGNPAAAQAEKDLYAVDKVNSLLKVYPDPNKMPEAQVNLVISEIGKIAQGGVPTGHEIDALKPGSAEGKLQALWGKLTNKPTPANAGAYLKEFQKYNKALASDAQKVIKDKYGRVIESSKKQLGDENYKALQDQYLNRFSQDNKSAAGMHAPGDIVTVKGKQYKVGSDGDSLEEVQ